MDSVICSPWAGPADLQAVACAAVTADVEPFLWAASELLFARTGGQWPGRCETTVRPVGRGHEGGTVFGGWGCGCHTGSMLGGRALELPGTKIDTIAVNLDGVDLVEGTDFRLLNGRVLLKTRGVWPACQNLALPDGAPGTFTVGLTINGAPPTSGRLAAAALACELALAAEKSPECRLPGEMQQLVRQDVTVMMMPPDDAFDNIPLVKSFIRAFNPTSAGRKARFRNPDSPRFFRG